MSIRNTREILTIYYEACNKINNKEVKQYFKISLEILEFNFKFEINFEFNRNTYIVLLLLRWTERMLGEFLTPILRLTFDLK
jgi:hypothetical protein